MLPGQSRPLWQLRLAAQANWSFYGGVLRALGFMAAPRLTDSQKEELVARYRQGETAQALAEVYSCSPNTVSRVLKAVLDPEELARIKKQARGGRGQSTQNQIDEHSDPAPLAQNQPQQAPAQLDLPAASDADADLDDAEPDAAGLLAIDDADDFADDGEDDGDGDEESDPAEILPSVGAELSHGDRPAVLLQPLTPGALPTSVYMLVDKTVELQARPLREFPELGALPDDEQERQALMLYANPRQAKRQCGRSQRVIKVPDTGILERTSCYLVAQGITRLVVEGGSLYAIPGS